METDCGDRDYTEREIYQAYILAKNLRHLMLCHDRAVQQLMLLDSKITGMIRRHRVAQTKSRHGPIIYRIEQRMYIYHWMREAYAEYRVMKWIDVQSLISSMFNGMIPDMINNIIALATSSRYSNQTIDSDDDSDMEITGDTEADSTYHSDTSFVNFNEDRHT